MLKSEINRTVIDNFLLYVTHNDNCEGEYFKKPMTWTPEELYKLVDHYIAEDHVDGVEGDSDNG